MTPEEMGKALGPGWEHRVSDGVFQWHDFVQGNVHVSEYGKGWSVSVEPLPADDAAPAVARLLVAAERIAAGAAVGRPSWPPAKVEGTTDRYVAVGGVCLRPPNARRFALDLLRAADEAEAQS